MNHDSILQRRGANRSVPVVPYPENYKGQALTPDLIKFSTELPRIPYELFGFFRILVADYAKELGCGNTEASRAYLAALERGEDHVWSHAEAPEIAFVSTTEKTRRTCKRVLRIMPMEQMFVLYPPTTAGANYMGQQETLGQASGGTKASKTESKHTLH